MSIEMVKITRMLLTQNQKNRTCCCMCCCMCASVSSGTGRLLI